MVPRPVGECWHDAGIRKLIAWQRVSTMPAPPVLHGPERICPCSCPRSNDRLHCRLAVANPSGVHCRIVFVCWAQGPRAQCACARQSFHCANQFSSARLQTDEEEISKKMHNEFDGSRGCTTMDARSPETRGPKRRKRTAKRSKFSAQRRLIFQRTNSEKQQRKRGEFH